MIGKTISAALLTIIVSVTMISAGCDPGKEVRFENAMNVSVQVYYGDRALFAIDPGDTKGAGSINPERDWPERVRAYSRIGTLVFDHTFTFEEIEALDYLIVIE